MNAIAAVNSDWGIGLRGTQQIVIPEDRRRFKEITRNGVVIAGRKTFEDFGAPLPDRRNIILTRSAVFEAGSATVVASIERLLAEIGSDDPDRVFVIGGQNVYAQLLPMCKHAYITKIEASPYSDVFFPNLDEAEGWALYERSETFSYTFAGSVIQYAFLRYENTKVSANLEGSG